MSDSKMHDKRVEPTSSEKTLSEVLCDYVVAKGIKPITTHNYITMLKRSGLASFKLCDVTDQVVDQKHQALLAIEKSRGKSSVWALHAINTIKMLKNFANPSLDSRTTPRMKQLARYSPPATILSHLDFDSPEKPRDKTLSQFFYFYRDNYLTPHTSNGFEFERDYRLYLEKDWGDRRLDEIKKRHVIALQTHITNTRGPGVASRVVILLSMIYNKAIEWEEFEGMNPASKVRKFKPQARERFLSADELPRFFAAVARLKNKVTQDFFLMLLFTGQRRRNVCEMRWQDINFDLKMWRIEKTKNGRSHLVPLVPLAIRILESRAADPARHPVWVFPRMNGCGPIWCRGTAWKVICADAGLEDLRIHDLRRSLASWEAITGASLPVIGATLAHRDQASTQIYARLNLDPVRVAMNKAVDTMTQS
jgi:integrase